MNLYLYSYNNYYNRIVKREESFEDYGDWVYAATDYNFKEKDGLYTSVTLNEYSPIADYMLVIDNADNIVSRWFIIESHKTREYQYELQLRRDVVADFYDQVITAPTFIEKATLSLNNPLIFNNEQMTFNKIKQQEIPLHDKFRAPWIVGYIDRKTPETTVNVPARTTIVDYDLQAFEEYEYYQYTTEQFRISEPTKLILGLNCNNNTILQHEDYTIGFDTNGDLIDPGNRTYFYNGISYDVTGQTQGFTIDPWKTNIYGIRDEVIKYAPLLNWKSIDYSPYIPTQKQSLLNEEGKILKVNEGYYKIHVKNRGINSKTSAVDPDTALGQLFSRLKQSIPALLNEGNAPYYLCISEAEGYNLELEPILVQSLSLTIPGESGRVHCKNMPYDVFAIPYDIFRVLHSGGSSTFQDMDSNMRIAQQIQLTLGTQLYDLQLLPYCPLPEECINSARTIDLTYFSGEDEDKYYSTILDEYNIVSGVVFWVANSDFTQALTGITVSKPATAIDCKVMNETRTYRICSPNYSSVFEISAAKNNGLGNFKAYCSYKPYTPYIQVAPEFNGLYGKSFEDARGLICGGNFSLPSVTDAWTQFELNNKNYELAFDRQIENLEFNNSLARFEAGANMVTGTLGGAATGAAIGSVGGGVGMGIGAAAGGVASLVGGLIDYDILIKRQQETLDFTKDQFGYTLGNIAAQPRTLTKVSAFNINNKIFPFIEIYSCTDVEVQALKNKLKYNGMTVGTIGTIEEYLQTEPSYIKGKVIRLLNLNEDFHIAVAISEEINKGVFI